MRCVISVSPVPCSEYSGPSMDVSHAALLKRSAEEAQPRAVQTQLLHVRAKRGCIIGPGNKPFVFAAQLCPIIAQLLERYRDLGRHWCRASKPGSAASGTGENS